MVGGETKIKTDLIRAPRSNRGRVVKASDSKSDSLWERRFESCRLRTHNFTETRERFDCFSRFLSVVSSKQLVRLAEWSKA